MAAIGKHVVSLIKRLPKAISGNVGVYQFNYAQSRFLYHKSVLGMENFVVSHDRTAIQFTNMTDKFRSKMMEYSQDDSKQMIFTEDLKNMIHLADGTEEDLVLIHKMMTKFNSQNKELRFGTFIFGPVVMRMYYYHNKPDAALKAFKDPALTGLFDQLISFQLLMDLLYINERYEDVLDVFDTVVNCENMSTKYPKHCVVLAVGALYKMNTPESLQRMVKLWNEIQDAAHFPMRRASVFAAALAINQGSPHIALEILSMIRNQNYHTVRNLKISALSDIDRPEDALPLLRTVLQHDGPEPQKLTVCESVLLKLRASIERQENKEVAREFERIEKSLKDGMHISTEPVETQINSEITASQFSKLTQQNNRLSSSWERQQNFQRPFIRQARAGMRPGLSELE